MLWLGGHQVCEEAARRAAAQFPEQLNCSENARRYYERMASGGLRGDEFTSECFRTCLLGSNTPLENYLAGDELVGELLPQLPFVEHVACRILWRYRPRGPGV